MANRSVLIPDTPGKIAALVVAVLVAVPLAIPGLIGLALAVLTLGSFFTGHVPNEPGYSFTGALGGMLVSTLLLSLPWLAYGWVCRRLTPPEKP